MGGLCVHRMFWFGMIGLVDLWGIFLLQPAAAAQPVPLFDGKTLTGWEGDTTNTWRVVDGALYDESRRKTILAKPTPEVLKQVSLPGEWNDYQIRAEGRRIRLWLNGIQTVDYTEPDDSIPQEGVVALQIHGNAKSEVRYKDIVIEAL